jgi:GTPase SAR1 family protein
MQQELKNLETRTHEMYAGVLTPLGARYHRELNAPRQHDAGRPTVLFLGNHSSGKSTFINYLLGERVQKTGIAPTDDGFTVLTYSETPEESTGPAAALRPEVTFSDLDRFGPAFLSRLKLKMLPNKLLESMTLVDSPGMIDAATTAQERGYDFMSAVRTFGEAADLILFFLDPEKPGTTGETIAAFTRGLSGMENKVLILMNKADTFGNIRDFARDYGALCWNLSRVVQTKDMPEIYTTYIPLRELAATQAADGRGIPLDGFDEAREEVVTEIKHALNRRVDNVISTLTEQAERLDMHVRVCWELKRAALTASAASTFVTFLIVAGTAGLAWLMRNAESPRHTLWIIAGGLLSALAWFGLSRFLLSRFQHSLVEGADAAFEKIYQRDFTIGRRDDLNARWKAIRGQLEHTLKVMGLSSIPSTNPKYNRRYRKLQKLLQRDIAALRDAARSATT